MVSIFRHLVRRAGESSFLRHVSGALSSPSFSTIVPDYDISAEYALLDAPTVPVDSPLRRIEYEKLQITRTSAPKTCPPIDTVGWGEVFTDHMLELDWGPTEGWTIPKLVPHHNISLTPAAPVFHYGLGCFEGMKAYANEQGEIRLFRPTLNMSRLNKSASRLHLPNFNEDELLRCIEALVTLDQRWVPRGIGYSLYLRPLLIGTTPKLGVFPSKEAKLMVIASPCGLYFPGGFKAIKLYANPHFVRAWPGGAGDCKVGGNYAPTLRVASTAAKYGCSQVLWLANGMVQEVGTTNIFFLIKNGSGLELVTPPLTGTILPGVTRQTVLDLARHWNQFEVSEREISIFEIRDLILENKVVEAFCTGTAAVLTPVKGVYFQGAHLDIPLDPSKPESQIGPISHSFHRRLLEIQHGHSTDFPVTPDGPWSPLIVR